jgi:hypothetical protein
MTASSRNFRLLRRDSEDPSLPRTASGAAAESTTASPEPDPARFPVGTVHETPSGDLYEVRAYATGSRWERVTPTNTISYQRTLDRFNASITACIIGGVITATLSTLDIRQPVALTATFTLLALTISLVQCRTHWRRHHIAHDSTGRLLGHPSTRRNFQRAYEAAAWQTLRDTNHRDRP